MQELRADKEKAKSWGKNMSAAQKLRFQEPEQLDAAVKNMKRAQSMRWSTANKITWSLKRKKDLQDPVKCAAFKEMQAKAHASNRNNK